MRFRHAQKRSAYFGVDEVVSAQTYGYLAQGRLEAYVSKLPENIEAVLTGRDPSAGACHNVGLCDRDEEN